MDFYIDPTVPKLLARVKPKFERTQEGDKPFLLEYGEPLKPFRYSQYNIADAHQTDPTLSRVYWSVLAEAASLMSAHGRTLGNVWLRAMKYEEQVAFGVHVDPSYFTMPICKGLKLSNRKAWYGALAHTLDGYSALPHSFNPSKEGSEVVTWVAFVYPALTDLLPDGRTVAQYLNDLESV